MSQAIGRRVTRFVSRNPLTYTSIELSGSAHEVLRELLKIDKRLSYTPVPLVVRISTDKGSLKVKACVLDYDLCKWISVCEGTLNGTKVSMVRVCDTPLSPAIALLGGL